MVNLLLVICVVVSLIFLLTQWTTVYYFDNFDSSRRSRFKHEQHKLRTNVQLFQDICENNRITCILADTELLRNFLGNEISHRRSGLHNHNDCNLFCGQSATTFLIKGTDIHNNVQFFRNSLQTDGFLVEVDEDFDFREGSLEQPHGKYKLIYHLFVEKDNIFIHICILYPRLYHEWSHTCNLKSMYNPMWKSYLENSIFCKQQNIFEEIKAIPAVLDGINMHVPQYLKSFLKNTENSKFLPCNYENARLFYSKYGFDTTDESSDFRIKANQILTSVVDVLSRLNIRFWLSSGTCLGWYRQCGFIPHSKDVDIGIWIKDYNNTIIQEFKKRDFLLKHMFGKVEDSYELSFTIDDLKLDIFFFYEDEDFMWNGGTQVKTGKKFKYLFTKFTLCWTTLNDLLVRVPCDTHKYILANYGEKWNQLIKTWDWKASPPNVRENGEWEKDQRAKVIQTFS